MTRNGFLPEIDTFMYCVSSVSGVVSDSLALCRPLLSLLHSRPIYHLSRALILKQFIGSAVIVSTESFLRHLLALCRIACH